MSFEMRRPRYLLPQTVKCLKTFCDEAASDCLWLPSLWGSHLRESIWGGGGERSVRWLFIKPWCVSSLFGFRGHTWNCERFSKFPVRHSIWGDELSGDCETGIETSPSCDCLRISSWVYLPSYWINVHISPSWRHFNYTLWNTLCGVSQISIPSISIPRWVFFIINIGSMSGWY